MGSVISDVTIIIVLMYHETHSSKMTNFIDKYVFLLLQQPASSWTLSLSFGLSIF